MSTTITDLKANLATYAMNPTGMQQVIYNLLDEIQAGTVDVVDATNPFVYLTSVATVLAAANVEWHNASMRKLYAIQANTEEDVYLHMSDKDFLDRFAVPSEASFFLLLDKKEVLEAMQEVSGMTYKKIVLARNTYFEVGGIRFSIQYPIEIRLMSHGGFQIVYDTTTTTPLQTLSSNVVEWTTRNTESIEYLVLTIPTKQFNIVTSSKAISSALAFSTTIAYSDSYYYCRAFHANSDGTWTELTTTHTDQVFDPSDPTVVLTVDQTAKTVTATIPPIYTTTGALSTKIRLDVYETKGELNTILGNYPASAFSANWLAIDSNDSTIYSAPFSTFKNLAMYSLDTVSGGSAAKSFTELRSEVITNSVGEHNPPITGYQLTEASKKNGFTLITNVDVVTNRVFLATRGIDAPDSASTYTGINACIGTYETRLDQMASLSGVRDNGERVTVMSRSLFLNSDGTIKHCTASEENALLSMNSDDLAVAVSGSSYLINPFTYVLDATGDEFDLRAYHFDTPLITAKTFVQENDTASLQVGTASYAIVKTTEGFTITVLTTSDDAFKAIDIEDIVVQLAFISPDASVRCYLNATYVSTNTDGEHYFQFKLGSQFDVDANNHLKLTSFKMFNQDDRIVSTVMNVTFDLFYTTKSSLGSNYVKNAIDTYLGTNYLDDAVKGLTYEKLTVTLGYTLDNLWKRARSSVSTKTYQTYAEDVYATYDADVYEVDPTTGGIIKIVDGAVVMNKLHSAGDFVLDSAGRKVVKHAKGDFVRDAAGNLIEVSPRTLSRLVELLFLDATYRFATNTVITTYLTDTIDMINDWIMDSLQEIEDVLLDQSEIYYYPKKNIGTITALVENGLTKPIAAEQSLNVVLYVTAAVYEDAELRASLEKKTIETIVANLDATQITISTITEDLKNQYGSDVIDVGVTGLGGVANNYPVVTILDDSARCSIKKKLTALSSGELTVEEDITIVFIRHATSV